jgi:DNA-binding transcriptional LysR family regulator
MGGELESQSNGSRLPSLLALRCFEAAARMENFSRAADELHLTHGAVSRAVRLLEEDLGVALFERRKRRVFLNEAGRKLARAVGDGLGLMRQACGELRASTRLARPLTLSCEPTLLMRWLIPRWGEFQAAQSGQEIHLLAGGGPFTFEAGIDLAIRRDDFSWPADYHVDPLFAERVGPVCRADKVEQWFDAQGLRADAPQLHTRTRPGAWAEWAAAAGRVAQGGPGQTFEHFYFSLQAAVAGLGVAIGPWHLVCDDIESGLLVAPLGFVEDGSRYCLFSPGVPGAESLHGQLLAWLREMGRG